jgi:hypothetical protein
MYSKLGITAKPTVGFNSLFNEYEHKIQLQFME